MVPNNISVTVGPDPFESSTILTANLPMDQDVVIRIFNVLGQEVEVLSTRFHTGKNVITVAKNLAEGSYFLKFTAGAFTQTIKILALEK